MKYARTAAAGFQASQWGLVSGVGVGAGQGEDRGVMVSGGGHGQPTAR